MKTLILGILSLFWLTACHSDDGERSAEKFGKPFQLGIQQEAFIIGQLPTDSLNVVVESITDNRCPEGAQCIWAGNAEVSLSLSDEVDTQSLTLCLGDCRSGENPGFIEQDTTSVTVGEQMYEVILKAVVPYPSINGSTENQEAVLEINP